MVRFRLLAVLLLVILCFSLSVTASSFVLKGSAKQRVMSPAGTLLSVSASGIGPDWADITFRDDVNGRSYGTSGIKVGDTKVMSSPSLNVVVEILSVEASTRTVHLSLTPITGAHEVLLSHHSPRASGGAPFATFTGAEGFSRRFTFSGIEYEFVVYNLEAPTGTLPSARYHLTTAAGTSTTGLLKEGLSNSFELGGVKYSITTDKIELPAFGNAVAMTTATIRNLGVAQQTRGGSTPSSTPSILTLAQNFVVSNTNEVPVTSVLANHFDPANRDVLVLSLKESSGTLSNGKTVRIISLDPYGTVQLDIDGLITPKLAKGNFLPFRGQLAGILYNDNSIDGENSRVQIVVGLVPALGMSRTTTTPSTGATGTTRPTPTPTPLPVQTPPSSTTDVMSATVVRGWNMIAIPPRAEEDFIPTTIKFNDIPSSFVLENNAYVRIIPTNDLSSFNPLLRGHAAWVYSRRPGTLSGQTSYARTEGIPIVLTKGWNMIPLSSIAGQSTLREVFANCAVTTVPRSQPSRPAIFGYDSVSVSWVPQAFDNVPTLPVAVHIQELCELS